MTYLDPAARIGGDACRQNEYAVNLEGRVPFLDRKFVVIWREQAVVGLDPCRPR
jgi:hypothetical protein